MVKGINEEQWDMGAGGVPAVSKRSNFLKVWMSGCMQKDLAASPGEYLNVFRNERT